MKCIKCRKFLRELFVYLFIHDLETQNSTYSAQNVQLKNLKMCSTHHIALHNAKI